MDFLTVLVAALAAVGLVVGPLAAFAAAAVRFGADSRPRFDNRAPIR